MFMCGDDNANEPRLGKRKDHRGYIPLVDVVVERTTSCRQAIGQACKICRVYDFSTKPRIKIRLLIAPLHLQLTLALEYSTQTAGERNDNFFIALPRGIICAPVPFPSYTNPTRPTPVKPALQDFGSLQSVTFTYAPSSPCPQSNIASALRTPPSVPPASESPTLVTFLPVPAAADTAARPARRLIGDM